MSLQIFCPKKLKQKSFLVCIYLCTKNVKKNCLEYKKQFEAICNEPVEDLYIRKYGEPEYTKPIVPRKREVRDVSKSAKTRKQKVQRNSKKRVRS